MNTQIIKVYYGSDALPYKDRERTVHFPITGSTFVGSSDTTKIRFYVDGYLADENALWISVSKRADGIQGSQFLTSGTDEIGDKYREMPLSGWYTSKKGDLYISLKGYQGGSTGYWDEDTGMYIVQGVPVIRATGSIKLAINYAPVGEYPYYEDEMASFQDLVAQLGGKLNITSGIKVVNSTSFIIIANEEEGQLFYSKADKKLYQLVSGNIVVFFETYDKDTLDTKFSGKVDKLTTSGKYVYAHITAQQGEIQVGEDVINNAIPNRTNTGQLKVPTTPTDNAHATSKQYVDSGLDLKADKATTYTKIETDNAIASAISSVYKYKGSVSNYSDLPTTGNEIGDVYNVEDTGDNYAWTGTDWDKLSGTVDLSGYYTKTETNNLLDTKADKTTTYTKTQTDTLLDTKADKATTYTKEQTDTLLNEKANTSGEYPLLTVGKALVAEQIENVNDEVGSTQTNPFLFQGTGTNDNTTETPTAPVAKHLELRGNSVVWNQLVTGLTENTAAGITTTKIDNSTIQVSGTATSRISRRLCSYINVVQNHKYLIKGMIPNNDYISLIFNGYSDSAYVTTYSGEDTGEGVIIANSNANVTRMSLELIIPVGTEVTTFSFKPQVYDLTAIYGADNEPISVLAFNRDYPLPYYEYNAGELKSCSSSKLITVGYNAFDGELEVGSYDAAGQAQGGKAFRSATAKPIKVIAGQTYILDIANAGSNTISSYQLFEYDGTGNFIQRNVVYRNKQQFTLTNNTQYIKFACFTSSADASLTGVQIAFHLTWDGSRTGYEPYIKHEYDLPSVELRSINSVYDTITPNGVYTQKIGVRAYESGDESDTSVRTDLANTYYVLETPIVSEVSLFAENIEVDDFGTMEFVPSIDNVEPIVPQGNKFFYPADYVLFIDDMYNRSKDGGETSSANNFVTQSELQEAIGDIPTGDFGFPIITAPSSTRLTNDEKNAIRNGCIINGVISGVSPAWTRYIFFPSGELYSGSYFGLVIVSRNGYFHIQQYQINDSNNNLIVMYGTKYIDIDTATNISLIGLNSVNGKTIPTYPSNTGTFVLKCVNGTLTWVAE